MQSSSDSLPPCHADPVRSAANGSFIGLELLLREHVVCQTHLTDALLVLAKGIEEQAQSINALVESNMALVQAMVESEGMDEGQEPRQYLDGTPVR